MQRAARFLYLQRTAFGGKVTGQNFGVSPLTSARFDVTRLPAILEAVHERLAGVVIERLPWEQFLARYDRLETLFYLDPTYWGNERDYGPGIAAEHLPRLTERFYRVDVVESRTLGGTGLGLALVKHILNRHRGKLSIKSRTGEGATFTVRLPLSPAVS